MGRIMTMANQRGGVGKTTMAINLSVCLAEAGQRIMLVDFNPQGGASSGLELEQEDFDKTVYDMMIGEASMNECIIRGIQPNLDALPSDMNLAGTEIEFQEIKDREKLLSSCLNRVRNTYDFIIINCPSSLDILTINTLTAAGTVLVPIQREYHTLEGLNQALKTVDSVKGRLNPELELESMAFTVRDAKTNLSLEIVESVRSSLNRTIYRTIIPRSVRLAGAPNHGISINLYDPRSAGAENCRMLTAEVVNGGEEL